MDSVQPHQRNKKLAVGARHEGLRAEGRTVPATARLRLEELIAFAHRVEFAVHVEHLFAVGPVGGAISTGDIVHVDLEPTVRGFKR